MEPGILEMCRSSLKHFESLGCLVASERVDFPMEKLWQTWLTLRHWIVAGIAGPLYDKVENRDQMKPEAIWEIEGGFALSASDVYNASAARSEWYQTVANLFSHYDYLGSPGFPV